MFKEYGELSTQVYEITKPIGHSINGDIEYYYNQLKNMSGKLLEAGVGTGRMLIPFLQKGLDIEGVDLSQDMLKQCEVNMAQHHVSTNLYQQNLVNLAIDQKYEAIIMPTGSFCLLPKDIIQPILTSFYRHLTTTGQLMIDIELPMDFTPGEMATSHFPLDQEEGILFTSLSETIDWHAQKTSYIHKYELLNKGALKQTEVSNFILHWYSVNELSLLLQKIGFQEVTHDIGYGTDENSSLITLFAYK